MSTRCCLRLGINIFFLTLIIRFTYYRVSRRKDYLFTYYLLGSIVFFICFSLKKLDIDTGIGAGPFCHFQHHPLPHQSDRYPGDDLSHLLVIGLSVVNALASKKISMIELGVVNSFIFGLTYFLEFGWQVRSETQKQILFEDIETGSQGKGGRAQSGVGAAHRTLYPKSGSREDQFFGRYGSGQDLLSQQSAAFRRF